jgi:hypothetical protein
MDNHIDEPKNNIIKIGMGDKQLNIKVWNH